jgi:hypothetical protein
VNNKLLTIFLAKKFGPYEEDPLLQPELNQTFFSNLILSLGNLYNLAIFLINHLFCWELFILLYRTSQANISMASHSSYAAPFATTTIFQPSYLPTKPALVFSHHFHFLSCHPSFHFLPSLSFWAIHPPCSNNVTPSYFVNFSLAILVKTFCFLFFLFRHPFLSGQMSYLAFCPTIRFFLFIHTAYRYLYDTYFIATVPI